MKKLSVLFLAMRMMVIYHHRVLYSGYVGNFIPPELEVVKYVYIVITIMNYVLWKGREGVFALSSMLI